MKKVLFVLMVLPFFFTNCSDTKDNLDYDSSSLLGTWAWEGASPILVTTNYADITKKIEKNIVDVGESLRSRRWIFSEGNKLEIIDLEYEDEYMLGTYILKEKSLIIKINNSDSNYQVDTLALVSLDKNSLVLEMDMTETYKGEIGLYDPSWNDDEAIAIIEQKKKAFSSEENNKENNQLRRYPWDPVKKDLVVSKVIQKVILKRNN